MDPLQWVSCSRFLDHRFEYLTPLSLGIAIWGWSLQLTLQTVAPIHTHNSRLVIPTGHSSCRFTDPVLH